MAIEFPTEADATEALEALGGRQAAMNNEESIVTDKAKGRILVVEDEAIISMVIEDMLEELGYDIVGPASRLDHALTQALQADIDVGLLDINVKGGVVFPVADVLEFRGIPFIFATGYGESALPGRFRGRPRLSKPFALGALGKALNSARMVERVSTV